MKKEVLYISSDGLTDPLGQSQIIPYLSGLSRNGFSISILSLEKNDRFLTGEKKIRTILQADNIAWIPLKYRSNLPFISQFFNYLSLQKRAKQIVVNKKIDFTHARSYIAALAAFHIKNKLNTAFIFDMRGFWADERVEGNIWRLSNPVHKLVFNFFKRKEKQLLIAADALICLTEEAKSDILNRQLNIKENKLSVIPCCADFNLFNYTKIKKEELNQIKKTTGISEQAFVISYVGSLGTWYMLEEMLLFFKEIQKRKKEAVFLFITPDSSSVIFNATKKTGINTSSVKIVSSSRENMPYYISLSNWSVFFIKPSYSKKASSPTKLAEILGCGIPVITNWGIGDLDKFFYENKCGFMLKSMNANQFKDVGDKIDEFTFNKKNLLDIALNNFNLNSGINKYMLVYNTL